MGHHYFRSFVLLGRHIHQPRWHRGAIGRLLGALALWSTVAAHAGTVNCAASTSTSWNCSGDFSSGWVAQNQLPSTAVAVTISGLTQNGSYTAWTIATSPTINNASISITTGSFELAESGAGVSTIDFLQTADGGSNGSDGGAIASGGKAAPGLTGIPLSLSLSGNFSDSGGNAPVIVLLSTGGNGGNGGTSDCCDGGPGGYGGNGGALTISGSGIVTSIGNEQSAIEAVSTGGNGGNGGLAGIEGKGGNSDAGGFGGAIAIGGSWQISTTGLQSAGVAAYSLGGPGGQAGNGSFFDPTSGNSGDSGDGGSVIVNLTGGSISTSGGDAAGVIAQSIGGHAGSISSTNLGLIVFAASGGSAGVGGDVALSNAATVTTTGDQSVALDASSIGGGGGNGSNAFAIFYSSSSAKSLGGAGGTVSLTNSGALTTSGNDASAIFAQSLGGTGGNGGDTAAIIFALGGGASNGADGGAISVTNSGRIITGAALSSGNPANGNNTVCGTGCAFGIFAQSIGGGGGNAGATQAIFSVGGPGGGGGSGGEVGVTNTNAITTSLTESDDILAESIGGGGGRGSGTVSLGVAVAVTIGGSGGDGGNGGQVGVSSIDGAQLVSSGAASSGIQAQSIGGGGGNANYALSGAFSAEVPTLDIAVGGSSGSGGSGGAVSVTTLNSAYNGSLANMITTGGAYSDGLLTQSVGGGGGNAGITVSFTGASETPAALSFAIGGSGGSGGAGGTVSVTTDAIVQTVGTQSAGLVAQSVGGGGGNGGEALSGNITSGSGALSFALGGSGGDGGAAGAVSLSSSGTIQTSGEQSAGLVAQSIGGGGGTGGFSLAGNLTTKEGALAVALSLGGSGGEGGASFDGSGTNAVTLVNSGAITTSGAQSQAILAQSIGGGGGNGGVSIIGTFTSQDTTSLAIGLGGKGGSGGAAGDVGITSTAILNTSGSGATAVLAQSIGGGGGNGGMSVDVTATINEVSNYDMQLGGSGGVGGSAGATTVTTNGAITTSGIQSFGILGQSVGGGGGNGGLFAVVNLSEISIQVTGFGVTVGGSGANGATGGAVNIENGAAVTTKGFGASAIVAQSVGGGGGNGGSNVFFVVSDDTGSNVTEDTSAFTLAVGGSGGTGGDGGTVTLNNSGAIRTGANSPNLIGGDAYQSNGLVAQSIGGGGGNGAIGITGGVSDIAVAFAVGGSGGSGGNGGTVMISNSGTIGTTNFQSDAIFAQSIGGGGGNGAVGINGAFGSASPGGITLVVGDSIGGGGGAGGTAGDVTISNLGTANLSVLGDESKGILAQSIGGGGGTNVVTISGQVSLETSDATNHLTISLGAEGNDGGSGGTVNITNAASITTGAAASAAAIHMDGLYAQSIGGGGGNVNMSISDGGISNADNAEQVLLSLGASGTGGTGGAVNLTNTGSLTVVGNASRGVFAQSVGGGGGDAVFLASGALTSTFNESTSSTSGLVNIALGGSAGTGGAGGTVTVDNTGAINTIAASTTSATTSAGMHGIQAQSIGGGGGNAIFTIGGNIGVTGQDAESANTFAMMMGGSGGDGGNSAAVTITNSGTIAVSGAASNAAFAQSVGGGGGAVVISIGGSIYGESNHNMDLNLGATGGSGGDGATVTLNNSGAVVSGSTASAAQAGDSQTQGLFAQSVGGGGGTAALAGGLLIGTADNTESKYNGLSITLGGTAGGGSGGTAAVNNTGSITTYDAASNGIFAQSVGAGGGAGPDLSNVGTTNGLQTWKGQFYVGGSGSLNGNGGAVTVCNGAMCGQSASSQSATGQITTYANGADDIFAQSVGAGGGDLANAAGLFSSSTGIQDTHNGDFGATLGGANGVSGGGGAITIDSAAGALRTAGVGSTAIFAQSVGGGGGTVLLGANSIDTGSVNLGGSGGANGNGGKVTVDITGGSINTGTGTTNSSVVVASYGIFAQSVGGGGGLAGNVLIGAPSNFGSGLTLTSNGNDSAGNGGLVNITLGSGVNLTTTGNSSVGIFAQSVGGGGGVLGQIALTPTGARIGSGGGTGAAGSVTVTLLGNITTTGEAADGVFAQAAAGNSTTSTTSATVGMTIGGVISVAGAGADGVYAQSSGANAGAVTVSINTGGSVQGGAASVISNQPDGTAVFVNGGTSGNALSLQQGASISALSGDAILYTGNRTLKVNNSGTVTGSVLLTNTSGSLGTFINAASGVFNEGNVVDANVFNRGTINIDTSKAAPNVLMSGDFTQTSSGVIRVGANFLTGQSGHIAIDGDAVLAGKIDIVPTELLPNTTTDLFNIAGEADISTLRTNGTLVHYNLSDVNGEVRLSTGAADFAATGLQLSEAEKSVAQALQSIWQEGGNVGTAALFAGLEIDATKSVQSYRQDLSNLSPGATLAVGARLQADMQDFANSFQSCPALEEGVFQTQEHPCIWSRVIGSFTTQAASNGIPGFNLTSEANEFGAQMALAQDWYLGGAFTYQTTWLRSDTTEVSGQGATEFAGLVLKHEMGPLLLSGAVTGSYGSFKNSRFIDVAGFEGVVQGRPNPETAAARLGAAYTIASGDWLIRPRLNLDVIYSTIDQYSETGTNPLHLTFAPADHTVFVASPALELDRLFTLSPTLTLRSFATGMVSVLSTSAWNAKTRLAAAPEGSPWISSDLPIDNVVGRIISGLQFLSAGHVDLRLQYEGEFSGRVTSHSATGEVVYHF